MANGFGLDFPDYPWETLAPYIERARSHPDGIVDLSIGTPVDATPRLIQDALHAASDAHGYPLTVGTPALRQAIVDWFARRRGVAGLDPATSVLPTLGSKEIVAWLPFLLGLGAGDVVARPSVAYPTYDIGARLAGAAALAVDAREVVTAGPETSAGRIRVLWVNSPGNPGGEVLGVEALAAVVAWARENNVVVVSDECYAELAWPDEDGVVPDVPSLLHPDVAGGSHDNLLVAYSLSKQSNLAGYRSSFLAGDPELIANLSTSRKHIGMIMPYPVQEATRVALGDDAHVAEQRARYEARRNVLKPAVEEFGLKIDGSKAGLYLWGTLGEDCWTTIGRLADLGILAGPGVFYGEAGTQYVRLALTATDERIAAAAARLTASSSR